MSDITTSIEIGISAIKAGAAIATWWEVRQTRKRDEGQGSSGKTGAVWTKYSWSPHLLVNDLWH
jgi:hypothetical protein